MPQLITDFDIDNTANVEQIRERLEVTSPQSLEVWDFLRDQEITHEGRKEAVEVEAKRLRERAASLIEVADQNEAEIRRPTPSDKKKIAKQREMAAKLKVKANEMLAERAKSSGIYQTEKLAKWSVDTIRRAQRFGVDSFNRAKAEAARQNRAFDPDNTSSDFFPIIRFVPAWPQPSKGDISKTILTHAKNGDARKAILEQREGKQLAPLPPDETIARVLADLRKKGEAPDVARAFRFARDEVGRRRPNNIRWPRKYIGGGVDSWEDDVLKILFWACGDEIERKVAALLQASKPNVEGITFEARDVEIAAIDAKLRELEFEECSLVWRMMKAGHKVNFRHDAHPTAVLGVTTVFEDATF